MNTINRIIEFYQSIGLIEFAENIENIEIVENPENLENNLINEPAVLNLGPPPVLQRHPPFYDEAEEVEELITDAEFQEFQTYDTPDNFVMPTPCSKCYRMSCYEDCNEEEDVTPPVALKLSFEEEMGLPPPPVLTRNINTPLLDEEWRLPPPPLTRGYTNAHLFDDEELLVALSEAEFFEQLQQEQDADESDEFDMPEGVQYVCLTINEDKDKDKNEDKKQAR